MEVHNVIEDLVLETVNDIFDTEERKRELGVCTCYQCRLDVACYVLNRVTPEYVISQRGVAHYEQKYNERMQKQADVVTLVREGIARIDQKKRPHVAHFEPQAKPSFPQAPLYNFPTIIGRILDGKTFEPMSGLSVSLYRDGAPVRMIDPNWHNPYSLSEATAGTYLYWPFPESASSESDKKCFSFEIVAEAGAFEPLRHRFSLELCAEAEVKDSFSTQRTLKLPDLYVFAKE
jgi:competence protein ComFB